MNREKAAAYSREYQYQQRLKGRRIDAALHGRKCAVCAWNRHVWGLLLREGRLLCANCRALHKAATGWGNKPRKDGTLRINPQAARLWETLNNPY